MTRKRLLVAAIAAVAALIGVLLGFTQTHTAAKLKPDAVGSRPPAPVDLNAVPYAAGRAYVSWAAGTGGESKEYHLETLLQRANGTTDEGGETVIGTNVVVDGLRAGHLYQFEVNALNPLGPGPRVSSNGITAVGPLPPQPPTNLTLTASTSDNEVTVSWFPSNSSPAAESYRIGVFEGSDPTLHQVGAVSCEAPCTTETIDADPGATESVNVTASNSFGNSRTVWSNQVTVARRCPLACLTVATGSPGRAETRPSDGFLAPDGPPAQASVLSRLAPTAWRTNRASLADTSPAALAQLRTAAITELMSDDWLAGHNVDGYAVTPWSNWATYSHWLTSDVDEVEGLAVKDGLTIKYWDVQNEPFGGHYYSSSDVPPASETLANFEEQFLVAYKAIKAADPNAQVIGPSLIAWSDDTAHPLNILDMRTFLDFCVANGIQLGGISFHDNNFAPLPGWYTPDSDPAAQPAEVTTEIARLRHLIADRPSLGQPGILVNEYGDPDTYLLPGWSVGRIAALDEANVAGANRSCWGNCSAASLDGLLAPDGLTRLPDYWVYAFYASMAGHTVPVSSTDTGVTGLATVDGTGTVKVLVGRHQSCTAAVSVFCPVLAAGQVSVKVQIPRASRVRVTVAPIPLGATTTAPLTSLSPVTNTQAVVEGSVTITTPALFDGDAAEITVNPFS